MSKKDPQLRGEVATLPEIHVFTLDGQLECEKWSGVSEIICTCICRDFNVFTSLDMLFTLL